MKNMLLAVALLGTTSLFANTVSIQVEGTFYPSPAKVHLDILQQELAGKAIEACGAKEAVFGLSDINIKITDGTPSPVGRLSKSGLDLFYPRVLATALVNCK